MHHGLIASTLAIAFSALPGCGGAAPPGGIEVHPFYVPCPEGTVYELTQQRHTWTPMSEEQTLQNGGNAPLTESLTFTHMEQLDATISAEMTVDLKEVIADASAKIGASLSSSIGDTTSVTITATAQPHETLHIQKGTYTDDFFVYSYYRTQRCGKQDERYGNLSAPETDTVWKTWH